MKVDLKLNGLAELAAALKALPAEVAAKNGGPLARGLRNAAKIIRDEARIILASNGNVETGRLSRAIVVQRDRNPGNVTERMVVRPRAGKSRGDQKGAWYWHFIEFGTERHKAGSVGKRGFIRPAFDATREKALAVFKDDLRKGIIRAAKRARAKGLIRG